MKTTESDILLTLDVLWKSGFYQKNATLKLSFSDNTLFQLPDEQDFIQLIKSISFEPNYIYQLGSLKDIDGTILFNESILNYLQRFKNTCSIRWSAEQNTLELAGSVSQLLVYQGVLIQAIKNVVFQKAVKRFLHPLATKEIVYWVECPKETIEPPFAFTKTNSVSLSKKWGVGLWHGYSMNLYGLLPDTLEAFEMLISTRKEHVAIPIPTKLLQTHFEPLLLKLKEYQIREVVLESAVTQELFSAFRQHFSGFIFQFLSFGEVAENEADGYIVSSDSIDAFKNKIEQLLVVSY